MLPAGTDGTYRVARFAEVDSVRCELRKHQAFRIPGSSRFAVGSDLMLVRYHTQTIHVHEINEEIDNVVNFDRPSKIESWRWGIVGRDIRPERYEPLVPNDVKEVTIEVTTAEHRR